MLECDELVTELRENDNAFEYLLEKKGFVTGFVLSNFPSKYTMIMKKVESGALSINFDALHKHETALSGMIRTNMPLDRIEKIISLHPQKLQGFIQPGMRNPLYWAVKQNNTSVIEYLLKENPKLITLGKDKGIIGSNNEQDFLPVHDLLSVGRHVEKVLIISN